ATANFDLGTEHGRENAIAAIYQYADGAIDGIVTFAGLAGASTRPGSAVASVTYSGPAALLEGLPPALAAARGTPAAPGRTCSTSSRSPSGGRAGPRRSRPWWPSSSAPTPAISAGPSCSPTADQRPSSARTIGPRPGNDLYPLQ